MTSEISFTRGSSEGRGSTTAKRTVSQGRARSSMVEGGNGVVSLCLMGVWAGVSLESPRLGLKSALWVFGGPHCYPVCRTEC